MKNTVHIVYLEGSQRVFSRETQATNPCDVPQELFDEWNHGSGRESKEFIDSHFRSLSVGEFVGIDGTYWQCVSNGWDMCKLAYVNKILNQVQENTRADESYRFARELVSKINWNAAREYREQL